MKREIKFRGLRIDGGGWVYGSLVNNLWVYSENSEYRKQPVCEIIVTDECSDYEDMESNEQNIRVIPYSLGQFTGLMDKNGVDIYEGDQFEPDTYVEEVKSVVRWEESAAKFVIDSYAYNFHIGEGSQEVYDNELSVCDTIDLSDITLGYCEVIGNIHEN